MNRKVINHPLNLVSGKAYFFKTPVSQSYCVCLSLFIRERKKTNENDFFSFLLLLLLLHDGTTMRLSVNSLLSLSLAYVCMLYINEEILLFFFCYYRLFLLVHNVNDISSFKLATSCLKFYF
jgi:hypothetical protein